MYSIADFELYLTCYFLYIILFSINFNSVMLDADSFLCTRFLASKVTFLCLYNIYILIGLQL